MFNRFSRVIAIMGVVVGAALATGCTRIETGTVGVRTNMNKEIVMTELKPGSWNQSVVGDIQIVPVKDVSVKVKDNRPLTSDGSPLDDLDLTVIYSLNPDKVAEILASKSPSYHSKQDSTIYLMHSRLGEIAKNEVYKEIRKYKSMDANDNRQKIEDSVKLAIIDQLKDEGIGDAVAVSAVQITSIVPNKEIQAKATEYVRVQYEKQIKTTEVEIAEKEALRMMKLANNSQQSIAYMNAQSTQTLANAVAAGKVQTIIVPATFGSLGNFNGNGK